MSLIGTLAKVAAGIAVAKGVQSVLKGRSSRSSGPGGGLGDILEQLGQSQQGGGGSPQPGGHRGGGGSILDEILGQLAGGAGRPAPGREVAGDDLGEIFKDFTKAKDPESGMDDLYADTDTGDPRESGGFGEIFDDYLQQDNNPRFRPTQQQEALAALMLRATLQAAKADGRLDHSERNRIMEMLGEVSEAERRFVENEMERPVDVDELVKQTPRGLETQIYTMSVMGIDLDQQVEAQYLHELATGLGLSQRQVNAVHDKLGVRRIYA